MLTVGNDPADVEMKLTSALLSCPGCGGSLAPWGHGRPRSVRGSGPVRLRPRRTICSGCGIM